MSRVTWKEWYRRVNAEWPAVIPPLTAGEAMRAARRLYRFGRRRTWRGPVQLTSGNRFTWIRRGVMYVNPERGWHDLVHALSHWCSPSGHGAQHARMELRMIKEVKRRGWLDGTLKDPERPPIVRDRRAERAARAAAAVERWERRVRRATTMLRKARRRLAYYQRLGLAA